MRLARMPINAAILAAAFLTLLCAHDAMAQTGTLSGMVSDSTGAPLSGADVRVDGTTLHVPTNDQGRYQLPGVPTGTHTVRALLLGFRAAVQTVTVTDGSTVEANFSLHVSPIEMQGVEVMVGSRAHHTAADELAVPVDVYPAEELHRQGTTETSQALQSLSPSVNFPHQSVTDATDIVRPFTLRGLSPDHTLVLLDGWRRHQTALVNTFAYGTNAGSSGVDLNAIPSSAIDRIEVLRDGASAQYGSDAIAGVVNIVPRGGKFAPFVNLTAGQYAAGRYPDDGKTANGNAGWGLGLGRGSLGLFAEMLDREPTNRAWADPFETSGTGVADVVSGDGQVLVKNNPVPQPNYHWGDGLERDVLTLADLKLPLDDSGHNMIYGTGGYSFRRGDGQGYRRYETDSRNWPTIYPIGFLPEFHPDATDYSVNGGFKRLAGAWDLDLGGSYGHNDFKYNLRNTLNSSLGPSLTTPTAPGPDGILGNADDPNIPNQTSFFAGQLNRDEFVGGLNASTKKNMGLPAPVDLSAGAVFRWEQFQIQKGELASYIDGGHLDQTGTAKAPSGSQVFAGFSPTDESKSSRTNVGVYAELESKLKKELLANVAGRFENYSDFGSLVTGKLALRYEPQPRVVFRAAASNGFRAPGLSQIHFSKIVTNVIGGVPEQIGVFPVDNPAAKALGAKPLKEETSINLSGGVAVTPVNALTLTLDYFNIKINDRILLGTTFDDAATLSILAAAGYSNVNGVQYFTNGLDTRTQGVDFTADYRVPMPADQTLTFSASANYTKNEITHVDPLPDVLVQAGTTETGILDVVTRVAIEKERPDWRGMLTGNYTKGGVHSLARISYYGKFSSAQPGYCDTCEEPYGAKTLVDAEVGYKYGPVDLSIGGRNLFDTYPDHPKQDFNNNFGTFPYAAASPFGYDGRYIYTRASLTMPN
jgi:iron complex outermembrane receptor protein